MAKKTIYFMTKDFQFFVFLKTKMCKIFSIFCFFLNDWLKLIFYKLYIYLLLWPGVGRGRGRGRSKMNWSGDIAGTQPRPNSNQISISNPNPEVSEPDSQFSDTSLVLYPGPISAPSIVKPGLRVEMSLAEKEVSSNIRKIIQDKKGTSR